MAMTRESSFLPTIKCSQCGSQVEISMMGEHICSGGPPPLPSMEDNPYQTPDSLAPPPSSRSPRKPVPVDIYAANKPYINNGPLTPMSHTSDSLGPPFSASAPARSNDLNTPSDLGSDGYVPSPASGRRPNGYGGLGEYGGYTTEPPPSPGPGMLQRMDTMAPGPFDHRRPSAPENISPMSRDGLFPASPYQDDRPGTAYSGQSYASGDSMAPPRAPRTNGYEGFGPPARLEGELQPPSVSPLNRSETYPRPSNAMEPPSRTPSAPGTRGERTMQAPGGGGHVRKPSMGPDTSRRPPPRKSLIRPARENKGSVDLAREFGVGNPYHTPSDSASSGYSAFSVPSHASSQTSPARSHTRRQPPEEPRHDYHPEEAPAPMEIPRSNNLRVDPMAPPRTQTPLVESPADLSASENSYAGYFGSSGPAQPYGSSPQREPRGAEPYTRWGSRDDSLPGRTAGASPQSRRGPGDLPYRGDCKACRLPIKGKSVSSADGRLTGKYHKACFVCTTCSEPFTSAEFYVLEDRPYCEQHYHKLNGSLCGGCGRGIEGQYVADEASVKYHVGCFCCLDCGRSLTDGYFEVDGGAYCEQDAYHRVNSAPPAWNGPAPAANYPPPQDPYAYGRAAPPPAARGAPGRGPMPPRPPQGMPGLPGRPGPGGGGPWPRGPNPSMSRPPQGPPGGRRPGPGMLAPGMAPPKGPNGSPRPQMNKRTTRLGMM